MKHYKFEELLEELDANSVKTLIEKNSRYSSSEDCLHNFNVGGDIFGGTAAEACWGYLTKHLVALRDMVKRNDFSNRDDFLEKCQDSINYIRFLWCIGNEGSETNNESSVPSVRVGDESVYMYIDFPNRREALSFLNAVNDVIKEFGEITLADIFDIIGAPCSYKDIKIIWKNYINCNILVSGVYTVGLPMPDSTN